MTRLDFVLPIAVVIAPVMVACSGSDPASPQQDGKTSPDGQKDGGGAGDGALDSTGGQDRRDVVIPPALGAPQVVLRHQDGHWIRIEAKDGAPQENLTQSLAKLSAGQDDVISVSSDAAWLVMTTSRFGCQSGSCVGIVRSDLSSPGEIVKPGGSEVAAEGRPLVASGGALVVYGARGPHMLDLYATKRAGSGWSAPVLLTADSPHPYNHDASLSPDGTQVVFDCGADPFGDTAGTEPCEVGADGSGFHVLFPLASLPGSTPQAYTQRPAYAIDDSIVFEGNPGANEQVYRFVRGGAPKLITNQFGNDNSPCVLRDGRIASLWLGRQGNTSSFHELKVMRADGSAHVMLIIDQDLLDIGLSCGG